MNHLCNSLTLSLHLTLILIDSQVKRLAVYAAISATEEAKTLMSKLKWDLCTWHSMIIFHHICFILSSLVHSRICPEICFLFLITKTIFNPVIKMFNFHELILAYWAADCLLPFSYSSSSTAQQHAWESGKTGWQQPPESTAVESTSWTMQQTSSIELLILRFWVPFISGIVQWELVCVEHC